MTISLICRCGARLEVDETFAGRAINCPDCQRALTVRKPEPPGLKTSGFALASLTVALVGGFTVVGGLAAVGLGWLGLRDVKRYPEQVSGRQYALAGIALGAVLTLFTLFALFWGQLLGLNNLSGKLQWAGKLDHGGDEGIMRHGFKINRPRKEKEEKAPWRWGEYKPPGSQAEPQLPAVWDDLILVNIEDDAHLLVLPQTGQFNEGIEACLRRARKEFEDHDKVGIFGRKRADTRRARLEVVATKPLTTIGQVDTVEQLLDKTVGRQERRFILQVVKQRDENLYFVLLAGARKSSFERLEPELRKALESFTLRRE
ncbi:MAG: DUF4190 domain-containing protein [Gemmataceae bacterium]|nr:DUF4190 domain-containing protein [Gemmataceae bacterium]